MLDSGVTLGFDFGKRRIGVAVGQSITGTATALAVIQNGPNGPDWTGIDRLVREWRPACFVVGLPLSVDGFDQAMTTAARAFGVQLHERYRLQVHAQDERYSSVSAGLAFADARKQGTARRKDAALLDAQAARLITERWLASQVSNAPLTHIESGESPIES